jgi:hypothetical protein
MDWLPLAVAGLALLVAAGGSLLAAGVAVFVWAGGRPRPPAPSQVTVIVTPETGWEFLAAPAAGEDDGEDDDGPPWTNRFSDN